MFYNIYIVIWKSILICVVCSIYMFDESIKLSIFNWYKSPAIKFELIQSLFNRETAVINKCSESGKVTIRMLKCHNVSHLDFIMNYILRMQETGNLYNLYYSLAKYQNGIPHQDWHLQERNNQEWTDNHYKEMISYDFLLDIDAGDFEELSYAKEATIEIKEFLDDRWIPYHLRFSGCGFHFVIPYDYLPKHLSLNPFYKGENIYKYCQSLGKFFYKDFSDLVDYKIYDSRRICKVPYSLSIYPQTNNVFMCMPFNNHLQLEMFDLKFFELNNLIPEANKFRKNHLFNAQTDVNIAKNEIIKIKEVV